MTIITEAVKQAMVTCSMEHQTGAIQECGSSRSASPWEDPQDILLSKNNEPNTIMLNNNIKAWNYLWAKMQTLYISIHTYT